jgi:4-carboxymuconolactone decarboxylase
MAAERRLVILVGAGVTACRRMGLMSDAERGERGMAVRRQVLGDEHVDRAAAGTTEFTAPFQDLITRYAWGEIWSRPGLTRPERSMITITALAALRQEEELALHLRAALRNGLTEAQIQEVLLQVAIYAGVPAANRAFAIAQRVLGEASGQPGEVSAAGSGGRVKMAEGAGG